MMIRFMLVILAYTMIIRVVPIIISRTIYRFRVLREW